MAGKLAYTIIARPQDLTEQRLAVLRESLGRTPSVPVVMLVNEVTGTDTAPTLEQELTSSLGQQWRVYRATYSELNLARMRTDCAELAGTEWCMWIDCDDELIKGDPLYVVEHAPPGVVAYYAQCVGMQCIDGGESTYYATEQIRIWRRGHVHWIGYTHEVLDIARATREGAWNVGRCDVIIAHSGYICSSKQHRERLLRNVHGVLRTLIECWDSDELRGHYLRVLEANVTALNDMSHQ
jgi:hypothetical protein